MAQQASEQVTLQAPDISCGHCVSSVQNRLGSLEGIRSVTASAETKLVNVEFDPTQISLDRIEAELDDEGYPVQK
ncbi:MAG TPA: cation transporter [Thermomicrobiales bacterium]|nr:cation transporter [Thermomicrobiales bacterium]